MRRTDAFVGTSDGALGGLCYRSHYQMTAHFFAKHIAACFTAPLLSLMLLLASSSWVEAQIPPTAGAIEIAEAEEEKKNQERKRGSKRRRDRDVNKKGVRHKQRQRQKTKRDGRQRNGTKRERRERGEEAREKRERQKAEREKRQRQKAKRERRERREKVREKRERQKAEREKRQRQKAKREKRERRKKAREKRERQKAEHEKRQRQKAKRERRERREKAREKRERQKAEREKRQRQKAKRERRERREKALEKRVPRRETREERKRRRANREEREKRQRRRAARTKKQIKVVKRSDTVLVHRREVIGRDGQVRVVTSRRYRVRHRRYRNRFRRGISIYYLPPVGIALAPSVYVVDSSRASFDVYVDTFLAPPVVPVTRRYTIDEIVEDPEIRAKVRSVSIDTIIFASGSAEIPFSQLDKLDDLADAIWQTLEEDPDQIFLIAGHADAVGSDASNLELSEERAAAVQAELIEEYGIPAENLEAVGYGEQYLRIQTTGPEPLNRRVVVRAIGALLYPDSQPNLQNAE